MFNPMLASAQALGTGLAQMLALLPSLFKNKSASPAVANNASSGSQATQQWQDKGGCKGNCGSQGGQNQDTQRSQDSGPSRDRSETPGVQQDSSRSIRAPQESSGADDHAGHDH